MRMLGCSWLALVMGSLHAGADEPIVGRPCQGCEFVFVDRPAELRSVARIAPVGEPGDPLVLEGTVRFSDGRPAGGIVVYAYHTDASGIYPSATTPHGRLRGWARTDSEGRYRFNTIRPGPYPTGGDPAHIHVHLIEPGRCTYYIDDVRFRDDPLIANEPLTTRPPRGGSGLCEVARDPDGTWRVVRDITLGANIRDYPAW